MKQFLHEGDVFFVDRGFRDSIHLLEQLGIQARMPSILSRGHNQMSTKYANASRLVTKIRWVVESANARIKIFKLLDHVLPNTQIPYIGDFVRIVCAISNKYFSPLCSDSPNDEEKQLADEMIFQSKKGNDLRLMVEEQGLARKTKIWMAVEDVEIEAFPRLSEQQLRELTFGIYQLRMSTSYIGEHLDGNFAIHVHVDEPNLMTVKMQSRHTSSRTYMMWISFSETGLHAWYCQCKAGSRVVGMCSHLAAIVWYLSSARHEHVDKFGVRDWSVHLDDAAPIQIADSCSDSDQ